VNWCCLSLLLEVIERSNEIFLFQPIRTIMKEVAMLDTTKARAIA
jgi:hypothetical protein